MKKLIKLLAVTMTGGILLVGCGDDSDLDDDLPGMEDIEEDPMDEELDEEMDEDTE